MAGDVDSGQGEMPVAYGRWMMFAVSDSTGETAESVARAAVSQFEELEAEVRRVPQVDSVERVDRIMERITVPERSVIFFTVVLSQVAEYLEDEAARRGIPTVDLMGPAVRAVEGATLLTPRRQPGTVHRLDAAYFDRIEAIEFAVRHDDGKHLAGLADADLVLLGVSRTSKTPVSMYLAHRCLRVANVPVVPEVESPPQVLQLRPPRVMGLTIQPLALQALRRERLKAMGLPDSASYGDTERIRRELNFAQNLFRRLGCNVIDVTHRAVEETATEVLRRYRSGQEQEGEGG